MITDLFHANPGLALAALIASVAGLILCGYAIVVTRGDDQ